MRPPRLILVVFCLIFLPILLTLFSALTSSPRVSTPSSLAGRATGLHALFSFNIPSSLFPPSAIISLTDDNSTFFLARPAAFGPLLPDKGLSAQLWIGSGFGERTAAGAEGELGCSDIPGWGEGDGLKPPAGPDSTTGKSGSGPSNEPAVSQNHRHANPQSDVDSQHDASNKATSPLTNDGTDDHLHHPLPESEVSDSNVVEKHGERSQNRQAAHADIQSIQESAEIDGKVVLLSRGGCGFLEKVKWVQRRGGSALIVGDDTRGGSLVTMYARGDTSNVTIPALFTSHTTAHLLSSLVPPQTWEDSGADDGSGSHAKLISPGSSGKQRVTTITTAATSVTPSPTSTHKAVTHESSVPKPKSGLFHSLMSLFGFSGPGGRPWSPPEDSHRPPSSGNINWILLDRWDEQEPSQDEVDRGHTRTRADGATENRKKSGSASSNTDGDGFVIGVQDWRDPDLVVPKGSALPSPTNRADADSTRVQTTDKGSRPTSATLKGGSITPGSGEYRTVEKSSIDKESNMADSGHKTSNDRVEKGSSSPKNGWFTKHFLWASDDEPIASQSSSTPVAEDQKSHDATSQSGQGIDTEEHDGLWVTLTPTSMSTSPFFDTLLVLVVSPLLTLTVVYVLLLLRSRIRRRRWRAPKSLVERLPVRTYHTITTSSSGSSSPRSISPGPVSPTSPLLGARSRPGRSRLPSRSQQDSKATDSKSPSRMPLSKKEKSGSTLWRRKYTGRQVECVVCLEEYVDGQSRVMSLPCGHEFHAECITPWLTTRRRTCPICKGDVVRSMPQNKTTDPTDPLIEGSYRDESDSQHSASSAPVPITGVSEDETSDLERHAGIDAGLLEGQASSAPPGWRNFAALSYSALSGDTIWHQSQTEGSR
ncbi:PA and RING finger domain protein [Aspergillus ellipticus CBS 707.79]|uniref:RING-type E3 ubiquitin transferase n=1 Tax=Aspergillus ellipticus CBS 707.79 TaxID=1448320 RepID=A0A319DEF7_9EURO|nr:PA and RING finger domain protein [Aspergillus ellipticus CBS 707.79]